MTTSDILWLIFLAPCVLGAGTLLCTIIFGALTGDEFAWGMVGVLVCVYIVVVGLTPYAMGFPPSCATDVGPNWYNTLRVPLCVFARATS
jgi:hypothetical protein